MSGARDRTTAGIEADDRGLSDLVGYTLSFAVIVTAVGLVSVYGIAGLEAARSNELAKNTERTFVLLGENLRELENDGAEKRTTEMSLRGGNLRLANDSRFRITVRNTSVGQTDYDQAVWPRRIQFAVDDSRIGYESGGTFRGPRDVAGNASVVDTEPKFVCGDDYAIVSLVALTGERGRVLSGGTARIVVTRTESHLLYPRRRGTGSRSGTDGNGTHLNVTVDSPVSGGWAQYFTRPENGWRQRAAPNDDTYTCEVGTDGTIYVTQTTVAVEIDR